MKNKIPPPPEKRKMPTAPVRINPTIQEKKSSVKPHYLMLGIIGGVILLLLLGAYFFAFSTKTCDSAGCFVSAADNCRNVRFTSTSEIGTIEYASNNQCVFTKTIVKLNENEGQGLKKFLAGKSLMCKYTKGNFDKRLVDSLIFGIENCDGELKTRLGEMLLYTIY